MRRETTATTTFVEHVAKPFGQARENPPRLHDLRRFVEECEGLPDDVRVHIDRGPLSESGSARSVVLCALGPTGQRGRCPVTAPSLPLRTLAAVVNGLAWVANEAVERVGSALDTRVCQLGNDLSRREDD